MKLLPADATDAEIVAACQEWIERMVAGDVAGGIDMLHVPGRYDDSQRWTPASLLAYIGNYGSWDPPHQSGTWTITSPAMAATPADGSGFRPTAEVIRHDADPHAGSVELDLPLNGEWSDLTALFEFESIGGGTGLSLYDIHVL